jgi:hypothetical protein
VPVPRSRLHLSDQQLADDDAYLALLEDMLSRDYFYYSYGFDLTNTVQRQAQSGGKDLDWKQCDDRFFWNRALQGKLIDVTVEGGSNLGNFILPIICGCMWCIFPNAFSCIHKLYCGERQAINVFLDIPSL